MEDQAAEPPGTWLADGRHYGVTTCTGPDKTWWELDDLGPAPGRGTLLAVEHDDDSRRLSVYVESAEHTIPFEVVEGFVRFARWRADAMNEFLDREQTAEAEDG